MEDRAGFLGHEKNKQVRWRDLTWIWRHLCVCPLIDHGQQPMKMYTEVMLLYKYSYIIDNIYRIHTYYIETRLLAMKSKLTFSNTNNNTAESNLLGTKFLTLHLFFSF